MKKILSIFLIVSSLTSNSYAEDITTADIVESGLNEECINYCIVGICYFLVCTPFGCSIKTSPRIDHYLPDLVVTVYDEPEENPWTEYRSVMGNAEVAAQQGLISSIAGSEVSGGNFISADQSVNSNIRFKEASVVGNPFVIIAQEGFNSYMCPSDAQPFMPYFSSSFDYLAWRWGIPDRFTSEALIPGKREIGSRSTNNLLGNTWGAVYPRFGFVHQSDDAKAAAVIAQRSVDIVTRTGQPHVYRPLNQDGDSQASYDSNEGSDSDQPLMSDQSGQEGSDSGSNEKRDRWQMISPKEDDTCKPFGSTDSNWSDGRNPDGKRQYAWNYWRNYQCCIPRPGAYLGHTSIPPVCL